ncbi:MAG: penicillin-binding protein 2, partial [Frankiaceae bacterium]|nr:penicillin-binding protein 2 [Frankiaceae bacterium]
ESESLGPIDLHTTIVKSCDTVYYGLANQDWIRDNRLYSGRQKPVEGVQRIARAFGLGLPMNVDLPGASSGHIADRNNQKLRWQQLKKDWCAGAKTRPKGSYLQLIDQENCTDGWRFNPGDQLNEDIGQGSVLASPLQMAVAYAALANGGTVFEPRLVKAIVAPDGRLIANVPAPVRGHLPVSQTTLDYIRNAMYDVPLKGTAKDAFTGFPMAQVRVGGKTGTAEVDQQHGYATAWFASFAGRAGDPAPRFVTVIMVDRGGQGGVVAAPSVREVWDSVFGLERHPAAFPTGVPPAVLPRIAILTGASPSASPSPSQSHALGDLFGPPGLVVRREDA